MPERYSPKAGGLLDVYQAATQMTDESGQSYPQTANALFAAATGPLGYYGAFTANMHTDLATEPDDDALLSAAISYGIPMVTSRQMLAWLDGRNSSSFSGITWSGNTLSFAVKVGTGANGLTGMVPVVGPGGTTLTGLTHAGAAVSYTTTTIKGVAYAMFLAADGGYVATYGAASGAAASSAVVSQATANAAMLSVTSTAVTTTQVSYGTSESALTTMKVTDGGQATRRSLTLTGLKPNTTYYYRVRSRTAAGRTSTVSGHLTTPPKDTTAPVVSGLEVSALPGGTAEATWRTSENTGGTLLVGEHPDQLVENQDFGRNSTHDIVVTGLTADRTYYYRVRSTDAAGNTRLWPARTDPPASFVSAGNGVADQNITQFRMGNTRGVALTADGVWLANSRTSGEYVSRIVDAQQMVTWDRLTYRATQPAGTTLRIMVRTGSTSTPDITWTRWTSVSDGGRVVGGSRFLQYRVEMTASRPGSSPLLRSVGFTHSGETLATPGEH